MAKHISLVHSRSPLPLPLTRTSRLEEPPHWNMHLIADMCRLAIASIAK